HRISYFFFFQAEDGIRDRNVTGVQTCALPILEVGLITEIPSQSNPMKKIYYVHDPLSRDEFIKKYPDEINRFAKKLEEMERKNNEYKERRKQKELESIRKVQKKDGII